MTRAVSTPAERDGFTQPGPVSFYPVKIPVEHNQLRQLIASPSKHVLYYAEDGDVWHIDTRAKTRSLVKRLGFAIRCLACGHGWLCAGGDRDGHFAAIRLPDAAHQASGGGGPWGYDTKLENLGGEIVNGISIHNFQLWSGISGGGDGTDAPAGAARAEPVALVTNNDRIVRMYALQRRREVLRSEEFGVPMNHASISPDGQLMITVGDCSTAYVHRRAEHGVTLGRDRSPQPTGPPVVVSAFAAWELWRRVELHTPLGQPLAFHFTSSWSSSGRYFATASEHGYVSVLDVGRMASTARGGRGYGDDPDDGDLDPCVTVVPSSRPMSDWGAVRSVAFAPAPWEFLLWTENNGRMCVADLRSLCRARQVVHLDCGSAGVDRCDLFQQDLPYILTVVTTSPTTTPRSGGHDIERELARELAGGAGARDGHGRVRATDLRAAANALVAVADDAGIPTAAARRSIFTHGLTEEESQIIAGLRATRQRQAALSGSGGAAVAGSGGSTGSANTDPTPQTTSRLQLPLDGSPLRSLLDATRRAAATSDQLLGIVDEDQSTPWRVVERAMIERAIHRWPYSAGAPEGDRGGAAAADEPFRELQDSGTSAAPLTRWARRAVPSSAERNYRALSQLEAQRTRRRNQGSGGGDDASLTTRGAAVEARRRLIVSNSNHSEDAPPAGRDAAADATTAAATSGAHSVRYNDAWPRTWQTYTSPVVGASRQEAPVGVFRSPLHLSSDAAGAAAEPPTADGMHGELSSWESECGTTGLAQSADGQTIYVGIDQGIFELKLDFSSRKHWPAFGVC